MPTIKHNVNIKIKTPGMDLKTDGININIPINDIPTAIISLVPTNSNEKEYISNIDKYIMSEISIYSDDKILFTGGLTGTQISSSSNGVSFSTQLQGGLYKLSRISSVFFGLNMMGAADTERVMLDSKKFMQDALGLSYNKTSVIKTFKDVLLRIYNSLTVQAETTLSSSMFKYTKQLTALKNTTQKFNTDILNNINIKEIGLDTAVFNVYGVAIFKEMVNMATSLDDASFWDVLILLCTKYSIFLGYHKDENFAIPVCPMGAPNLKIETGDIISLQITPMPIGVPTRCFFTSYNINTSNSNGTASLGCYPPIDQISKYEESTKMIKIIRFDNPSMSMHIKLPVPNITNKSGKYDTRSTQSIDDDVAKSHLMSEIFKDRRGSLTIIFSPDIIVGSVIEFTDPFFDKTYQGFVLSVSHTVSSTSIFTQLSLQYVMSKNELDFFGISDYAINPLYPSFTPKDLVI